MSVSIARISPHGFKALMDVLVSGTSPFTNCTVEAMFLDTTETLSDKWNAIAVLSDMSFTLGEHTDGVSTLRREVIAVTNPTTDGPDVFFTATDPKWLNLLPSSPPNAVAKVLYYVKLSGATEVAPALEDRIPLAIFDHSFTPDGTDRTFVSPINGLFALKTNGC